MVLTRIFGISDEPISGHVETALPLEVGGEIEIKGRMWVIEKIGENLDGERLANLRHI